MNSIVQRYLPPALVFGAAAFFGWPPSAPLDLGDDVVRANSVRWRPDDLTPVPRIELSSDPFADVFAVVEEDNQPETVLAPIPVGPSEEDVQAGLRLDGFASMAGRTWAVVNGRPRLAGDAVRTDDANQYSCKIVSIQANHIVVRCEGMVTKIHLRAFGSQRPGAEKSATPVSATPVSAAAAGAPAPDGTLAENPSPPQA